MDKQKFEVELNKFKARVSVDDHKIYIRNTTALEKYVIALACNTDRTLSIKLNKELYCMPWLKHTIVDKDVLDDLSKGLDNLMCDTMGTLSAIDDGEYNEDNEEFEEAIEKGQIEDLHDTAVIIMQVFENL